MTCDGCSSSIPTILTSYFGVSIATSRLTVVFDTRMQITRALTQGAPVLVRLFQSERCSYAMSRSCTAGSGISAIDNGTGRKAWNGRPYLS
jgi:hypothetical protein